MHLLAERFDFLGVMIRVFWKRESRPVQWHLRRLLTCQLFLCLHIYSLWPQRCRNTIAVVHVPAIHVFLDRLRGLMITDACSVCVAFIDATRRLPGSEDKMLRNSVRELPSRVLPHQDTGVWPVLRIVRGAMPGVHEVGQRAQDRLHSR
jgi:hypothetical protein